MVSDPTGVRYEFKIGGGIQGTDTYNPYGQCTSCSANTPFGFEDGYTDNNGLIYLVNRYYDPATDQFISVDPLVNQTGQAFAYSADDPVNASDPSGLCGVNTSSVGGFFSSLGTDLNITSSSNCAHSWVQVGQENFNAGYNSLSSTQQTIDRDTVLGATTALACIVVCEAVIASATATASGIGSSLGALCEVDATACAGFLTAGTVSAAATAAEGLCNAAASVSSSPSQKQYWHDAAKGFRNADLGHLLSKLFE